MEILALSLVYQKVIKVVKKNLTLLQQPRLEDSLKIKNAEHATF